MENRLFKLGFATALLPVVLAIPNGCAGPPLMPTPNLFATAGREPFEQIAPELQTTEVKLLYVTDRAPERDEQGYFVYGHKRSRSMAFGVATVDIGDGETWDRLHQDSHRRERSQRWNLRLTEITG